MLVLKRFLYGLIGKYFMIRYGEFVPAKPSPIFVPSEWLAPHKRARIYFGLYEENESAFVKEYLSPDIDAIELGSGIGVVSSHICNKLSTGARFFGVEANPQLVSIANQNVTRISSTAKRLVENGVVCGSFSEAKAREFYIQKGDFQFSSADAGSDAKAVNVPELVLSDLISRHGIDSYQLVSDIEGAELEFLSLDAMALAKCKKIIIELHDTSDSSGPVSIEELSHKIQNLGFSLLGSKGQVYAFESLNK